MQLIWLTITLAVLAATSFSEKASFNGFRLIRLYPISNDQVEFIHKLEIADPDFDIWNMAKQTKYEVDVALSPEAFEKYVKVFNLQNLRFEIVEDNLQNKINEQEDSMIRSKNERSILLKYARYSEILNFIDDTVASNSDIASSYVAGPSYENRLLKVIVLKTASSSKSIWIDCGIHAREWVSPASCVYLIDQLIKEYRNQESTTISILNKYEIHILPLVNPDGYEYSHTSYRLWRKNRNLNTNSQTSCVGTDLNRNFPFRWRTGGSSTNTCSDTYAGAKEGSEPETQAIIKSIANRNNWDAFLSVHSYGNWWLTQWGHSTTEVPPDHNDIMAKGQIGANAIKAVNGSVFVVGPSAQLLYINTGSSADWAKGAVNIKYAYVLELRPGPGTPDYTYGFTLPENRMPIVAAELYAGVKAFIKSIL